MTDKTPFLTAVRGYLNLDANWKPRPGGSESGFAPITVTVKAQALRNVAHDLAMLNIPKPSTPRRLERIHIVALLTAWKMRGLAVTSQHKMLADLEGLLDSIGNPVIRQMRRDPRDRRLLPPNKPGAIVTLTEDELDRLRAAAAAMEGWRGSVCRFLVGALPYTGLRPKEVRLAKLADVDLSKGFWFVSAPKGAGKWAAPDFAHIPPVARQAFVDFLQERSAYLAGEESEWLLPLRKDNLGQEVGAASEDWLRHLKAEVAGLSGVRFRGWKSMRSTYCQMAIDAGASISAVSKAMRHGSTLTTELYYGRLRTEKAFAEIDRAFERPVKVVK